jgi:hypothetical protein
MYNILGIAFNFCSIVLSIGFGLLSIGIAVFVSAKK